MAYLRAEDALDEYENVTRKVFGAWKIRNLHEPGEKDGDGKAAKRTYTNGCFTDREIALMREDPKFYQQHYDRLMQEINFARILERRGMKDGMPWFLDKESEDSEKLSKTRPKLHMELQEAGLGMAAMRPVQGESDNYMIYKPYGAEKDRGSWLFVTDREIRIGEPVPDEETRERMKAQRSRSLLKAMWRYGKSLSPVSENALLAQQQMAIQRWGNIRLRGEEKYIRNSLEVAVKFGTWQHITNPELQGRINEMVRNRSGADAIWESYCGIPMKDGISASSLNTMLFDAHDIIATNLEKAFEKNGLRMKGMEPAQVQGILMSMRSFGCESRGDFVNRIIESNRTELSGKLMGAISGGRNPKSYTGLMANVSEILEQNPDLKRKIEMEIAERAEARQMLSAPITETGSGSIAQSLEEVPHPVLAMSGINEANIYELQDEISKISPDSLAPEVRAIFNNTASKVQDLVNASDGDQTQAKMMLVRENSNNPTLSMQLHMLGIQTNEPAPDFANPNDQASMARERYISSEPIGAYSSFDNVPIKPDGSDNSYTVSRAQVASNGKARDMLVIRQDGDETPLAIVVRDPASNKDILVGCAMHPGADNSSLAEIGKELGNFRRVLSDAQRESLHEVILETPKIRQAPQESVRAAASAVQDAPKPAGLANDPELAAEAAKKAMELQATREAEEQKLVRKPEKNNIQMQKA